MSHAFVSCSTHHQPLPGILRGINTNLRPPIPPSYFLFSGSSERSRRCYFWKVRMGSASCSAASQLGVRKASRLDLCTYHPIRSTVSGPHSLQAFHFAVLVTPSVSHRRAAT